MKQNCDDEYIRSDDSMSDDLINKMRTFVALGDAGAPENSGIKFWSGTLITESAER